MQDPQLTPQAAKEKKNKKRKQKVGQVKVVDKGLEGFADWGEPKASEPAKEKEDGMSILAAGFVARIRNLSASSHGENTPGS